MGRIRRSRCDLRFEFPSSAIKFNPAKIIPINRTKNSKNISMNSNPSSESDLRWIYLKLKCAEFVEFPVFLSD